MAKYFKITYTFFEFNLFFELERFQQVMPRLLNQLIFALPKLEQFLLQKYSFEKSCLDIICSKAFKTDQKFCHLKIIALLIKYFDHVFHLMPLAYLGRNPAAGLYCKFNASIGMVE